MPKVTQFICDALQDAPSAFTEKELALRFLAEGESIDRKKELAIQLLRVIAEGCDCPKTWRTLVEDRLVAAETAMRYLLPTHRDHVLHSAHLYLLGIALYLTVLRRHPTLAAVIADTHFRDIKALYSASDIPYSCQLGILDPNDTLNDIQSRFSDTYEITADFALQMNEESCLCTPSMIAADTAANIVQIFRDLQCCTPGPDIADAFDRISHAITLLDRGTIPIENHLLRSLEDVDQVFRRRWGMAAILHDSAYPIELAARQIEDYVEKTIASLGCSFSPCPKPFGLSFNRLCDFVTVPLIQNVCSQRFNPLMYNDNSVMLIAANLSHKLHVEYSPETLARMMVSWLESGLADGKIDHGVFSSLLLLRQINHELLERLGDRSKSLEPEFDNPSRRVTEGHAASSIEFYYVECVDAAAAVYLHNTKRYVGLFCNRPLDYRYHPIAWLLFLCDQLQEWLRPSGESYDDPMFLFKKASEYEMVVDAGPRPRLYFSYPDDTHSIGGTLQEHLRLFDDTFVRQAH